MCEFALVVMHGVYCVHWVYDVLMLEDINECFVSHGGYHGLCAWSPVLFPVVYK